MNDTVAHITFDPENKKIADISVTQKQFKFKCKRCAALCCKLGGPVITEKDSEKMEKAGYSAEDFREPINSESLPLAVGSLKTNDNGSCFFLQQDTTRNGFKCGIYDFRPYPLQDLPFQI